MRRHRIYLKSLTPGTVTVRGDEARHLIQVLRVKPGSLITAFDGAGLESQGMVTAVDDLQLLLELGDPTPSQLEAQVDITLAVALLKGDRLSEVVRQATELGVNRFRLFISAYCEVRQLSANKHARLKRIAKEAAKQCRRSVIPEVIDPVPLAELPLSPVTMVAHPFASATLRDALPETPDELTLMTGPEGGFSDDEVRQLEQRGAIAVRLGARILRSDTAPVALTAALLLPEAL